MTKERVIIAGGGIGGLTLALTFHQIGVPFLVLDSSREVFLTNAMSGDYARMKSEIMSPIQKVTTAKE